MDALFLCIAFGVGFGFVIACIVLHWIKQVLGVNLSPFYFHLTVEFPTDRAKEIPMNVTILKPKRPAAAKARARRNK